MRAVQAREDSAAEAAFRIAHLTAQFIRAEKLKLVEHYLPRPANRQSPQEMVAVLETLRAAGANITIKRRGG